MYDTGGDNSGYGEDRTMKFSDRMERIIQLLTVSLSPTSKSFARYQIPSKQTN